MSSSLSICRTLNLWEKSFPVPRSSETATIWSVAASRLVRLREIFLPIKFSCPTFRGSAPTSSTRSIPTAQHSPAYLDHFPINKTAGSWQEDCMGRAPPFAHCISGKKMCGKRWGLLFSAFLSRALTGCPQIQDSADS